MFEYRFHCPLEKYVINKTNSFLFLGSACLERMVCNMDDLFVFIHYIEWKQTMESTVSPDASNISKGY